MRTNTTTATEKVNDAVAKSAGIGRKKGRISKDTRVAYLLILPTLIILAVLIVSPMIYNFVLSFFQWNLISEARFVGLKNYIDLMGNSRFLNGLWITFLFTIISFVIEFSIGLGLALLLNQNSIRGEKIIRSAILLPLMLTPIVMGLSWRMMLNYDFGILNYFTMSLGFDRLAWLVKPHLAFTSIVIAEVWHMTGYVVLILSAGLASLPDEPYEAAKMDGASTWQTLCYVTLPLLKPLIIVICVFRTIELIRIFDMVYTLTGGGPGRATETLSLSVFSETFTGWKIGFGAAGSFVIFFLTASIGMYLISREKENF